MITVVLSGVEHPGNLGAVARTMKNFGCTDLVLLQPRTEITEEARNRAKHAGDVLEKAVVVEQLPEFDLVIGTTAQLGSDYNLPRTPLFPSQLASRLAERGGNIALVFGCESDGLTNEQLAACDFIVTIPTSKEYPALNLSHAVAIILYAITTATYESDISEAFPLVKAAEKEQLRKMIDGVLGSLDFSTAEKRETQQVLWGRLVGKSMLTQREAMALMGFFRKFQ